MIKGLQSSSTSRFPKQEKDVQTSVPYLMFPRFPVWQKTWSGRGNPDPLTIRTQKFP